jgi:phosphoribosylformylglycinamidine synthase
MSPGAKAGGAGGGTSGGRAAKSCPARTAWSGLDDAALKQELAARALALTVGEARELLRLIGRDPTPTEARLFDILWSEHCSYKSSRKILARLPTTGSEVILGPGEDAGVVHLGTHDGVRYALVIGHESHNHPSQVLPVEGAATGIGGIVRDVFCMGAEVVGVLDALRFGDPTGPEAVRVKDVAQGVVQGIMEYGNALGVPNLGGDVFFDSTFDDNCLVNVVALGVCPESRIIRSRAPAAAKSVPHVLILVGKPTDMTGFGGASFASAALDAERAHEQKGAVQVHDPFLKRVLFEATEAVFALAARRRIEIGFKDLGAGGLACAAVELAAAAVMGMEVDLSAVPVDEPGHLPEVIACAETQERFALVVPADFAPAILAIYNEDFELPALYPGAQAAVIGRVLATDRFVLKHKRQRVGDLAATVVTAGIYHERPAAALPPPAPATLPAPDCDPGTTLLALLGRPNLASREFVYRGYDTDVRGRAVMRPGEGDAGVIAPVPGAPFGLAIAVDGTPAYGRVDPYLAAVHATLEAMRNVACVGAEPIALTDCLNYGSPEDPLVMAAFIAGVDGIAAAARGIGRRHEATAAVPVVSGNVSFYNHSAAGRAIAPSPIVACAGRLGDWSRAVSLRVKAPGSRLLLLGARRPELAGSELLDHLANGNHGAAGPLVPVDFAVERRSLYAVLDLIERGWVSAAHDISAGGFAVAVAEMLLGISGPLRIGADCDVSAVGPELAPAALLFGEAPGFVLEVPARRSDEALAFLAARDVPSWTVGVTTVAPRFRIEQSGRGLVDIELARLAAVHRGALAEVLA